MTMWMDLFLTFFKIGLFTFGGGYAMLSLIENTCVESKQWITHEEMMTVTVIAESTPGPVAINCATYVGYQKGGFWGAVAATLGVVLPSFVIIYLIAIFLEGFLQITWVARAFQGIRIAVGLLIVDAAVKLIVKMKRRRMQIAMVAGAVLAVILIRVFALNISSVTLMLGAALIGIAAGTVRDRMGRM